MACAGISLPLAPSPNRTDEAIAAAAAAFREGMNRLGLRPEC
jgi:hypothetical protein